MDRYTQLSVGPEEGCDSNGEQKVGGTCNWSNSTVRSPASGEAQDGF